MKIKYRILILNEFIFADVKEVSMSDKNGQTA